MSKKNVAGLSPYLSMEYTMGAPHLDASQAKMHTLLNSILKQRVESKTGSRINPYFWSAETYGLSQSSIFRSLSQEAQTMVLKILTDHFLVESSTIENLGINYCAKMILLSETQEEKSLYSLFAADEAVHLREIQNFIDFDPSGRIAGNPFLQLISDVVQHQSSEICHGIIQVLLEGFGIHHYTALKNTCVDLDFKMVLSRIVQDEAAHHGSGILFATQNTYSSQDREILQSLISAVTQLLQFWSFPVLTAVELVVGHLSIDQKIKLLEEISMEQQTHQKMIAVKRLLNHGELLKGMDSVWMESAFSSLSPQVCAHAHHQMLGRTS